MVVPGYLLQALMLSVLLQVLLAMHANVEDRGIKGDITPLMAAASGGYVDIVKLLLVHGADVNAQSSTGKYNKSHSLNPDSLIP